MSCYRVISTTPLNPLETSTLTSETLLKILSFPFCLANKLSQHRQENASSTLVSRCLRWTGIGPRFGVSGRLVRGNPPKMDEKTLGPFNSPAEIKNRGA